jgi:hypothetical protein
MPLGSVVASFQGAQWGSPWINNSLSLNSQEAVGVMFGGNTPEVQFQAQPYGQQTGPTTAFSTTIEARRWDHVSNAMLLIEKMHESQEFPLLLAPLELAKGMTFSTRIYTSNLEPPEEAPEHVPAPYSSTQWSETKTALTMVHRSVKFSMHELKTDKGQQDYKVHMSNLALMFLRDTHNVILRKFARAGTLLQAIMSFFPPSNRMHKELMHNTIRSFGMLNVNPQGLDAIVANVKQVGTTQNVDYDTCVVPYGSLSNMALGTGNFIASETTIPLARELAKMADINYTTKIPTLLYQNSFNVFQYQQNNDQIKNPQNDPLANTAVVATYHPFGSDTYYLPGARDIQIISASSNGWATLKLSDAIEYLELPNAGENISTEEMLQFAYQFEGVNMIFSCQDQEGKRIIAFLYGQVACLWNDTASIYAITQSIQHMDVHQMAQIVTSCLMLKSKDDVENYHPAMDVIIKIMKKTLTPAEALEALLPHIDILYPYKKYRIFNMHIQNLTEIEELKLMLFAFLPTHKASVQVHMECGINFPFEVAAVRPFIELETKNMIFCKRGRETAVTYCLPPWTFIGRDNRIEMVDMKFGFWRECHIERPRNILVAEHAYVSRVRTGMDTRFGKESDYLNDPMHFHSEEYDVYPMITGPLNPNRDIAPLVAIKHTLLPDDLKTVYTSLDEELKPFFKDISKVNVKAGYVEEPISDAFQAANLSFSPTMWSNESFLSSSIPRICGLGTTRQMKIETSGSNSKPTRYSPGNVLYNKGHMKELDSEEWIGTLCGFALGNAGMPKRC